jgi:4-aminobutyrate--pyruvate transaminase
VAPGFQAALRSFADHPLVGEARGVGLVGALEMVADKSSRRPFDPAQKVGPRIARAAREHGLVTRAMGDTMGFSPPLVISQAEITEMFTRFGRALDEVAAEMQPAHKAA